MVMFKDYFSGDVVTLGSLYEDWKAYRDELGEEEKDSFCLFLANIIEATEREQNDLDLFNCTWKEVRRVSAMCNTIYKRHNG